MILRITDRSRIWLQSQKSSKGWSPIDWNRTFYGTGNFSEYQSAYRWGHSTETALLKITDDIHSAMEARSCVVLLALDISAAFDTINHEILLKRLECDFGITGVALEWIRSYISDRECYVAVGSHNSDSWKCASGIPQGSVLGPLFFSLYVAPIAQIFSECGIKFHQYADDTQLYTGVNSADISNLDALRNCVRIATNWFLTNDLQLNTDKTEAMLFGTRQQLAKHQDNQVLRLGDCDVKYGSTVKILGVQLDSTLSLVSQVDSIVRSCNYHIRALRHIRKCLTLDAAKTIAFGLVTSRLDYCNSLLFNTSKSNISKLQHVQNNLVRVVAQSPWRSDARPLLNQLHWLPIEERIKFKIAVITHKVRSGSEPRYLSVLLRDLDSVATRQLRSGGQSLLVQPFVRSSGARGGFSYAAPSVWNSLGRQCRTCDSVSSFKKTAQNWTVCCTRGSLGDHPSPWCIRVAPPRSIAQ